MPALGVMKSRRADLVLATILLLPLLLAGLLWMYYPVVPKTVVGWLLLVIIGIPTWLLLEWMGDRVLGARFFSRLGRAARIALAVPVVILLLIVAAYIIRLGQIAIGG
jgi:hypothetical protein